jgi:nucleoid DNA-binding protein
MARKRESFHNAIPCYLVAEKLNDADRIRALVVNRLLVSTIRISQLLPCRRQGELDPCNPSVVWRTKVVANLTKRDLMHTISDETGLPQHKVLHVIDPILAALITSLAQGQTVELRNFGVFVLKTRKRRMGRNPRHPENEFPIPAHYGVKFKAGKILKARVSEIDPVSLTKRSGKRA